MTAPPRRDPPFSWRGASLFLVILVVAGLIATRFYNPATLPANPKASPIADYGPPPGGVPLLYVHDPNHEGWLIGFDWQSGRPRGTVKLGQPVGPRDSVGMSPDGQLFAVSLGGARTFGLFFDRLGQQLPRSEPIVMFAAIWADDNRHLCSVLFDKANSSSRLVIQLPGEELKTITALPPDPSVSVAACSIRNDQITLVSSNTQSASELWAFRLSDGKPISHTSYSARDLSNVVGSRDSLLIAENSSTSKGYTGPASPSTFVRRVSDRAAVGKLDPSINVLAFSGNGALLLVSTSPWSSGPPTHLAVIDPVSGGSIWRYDGPDEFAGAAAQPDSRDFAIALKYAGAQVGPHEILIVHGDRSTTRLPERYEAAW